MTQQFLSLTVGPGPLVAMALHHGHDVRADVQAALAVDGETRLREEDPHTGAWTTLAPTRVIVHRSRFEVDLNRPREECVYMTPEAAWGIDVWGGRLTDEIPRDSKCLFDTFYLRLAEILEDKVKTEGAFVVFDLHSYNHRRGRDGGSPARVSKNPDINVGTGHMDRGRWANVVDAFILTASQPDGAGHVVDVRENVRFEGGYLTRWVAEHFPTTGCALAIDVKKTFMDEWTGALDVDAFRALGTRLAGTTGPVRQALATITAGRPRQPARRQAR